MRTVKLHIWDTAGQEKFKTITRTYYRGAQGIMVVYDVTNRESFRAVKTWLSDIAANGSADVPKILIGAKCDAERDAATGVPTTEGQELADALGVSFLETSALSNTNVEQAFEQFSREIIKKQPVKEEAPRQQLDLAAEAQPRKCC